MDKTVSTVAKTLCEIRKLHGNHVSLDVVGYELARCLKFADPGFNMREFQEASHCHKWSPNVNPDPNAWDVT